MLGGLHVKIWTNHIQKLKKRTEDFSFQFFINKSSILMLFVLFFHVVWEISNFNMWTAKHLAQASCTEFTLLSHTSGREVEKKLFYRKILWHLSKPEFDFTIFFSIILCNMYDVIEPHCAVSVAFSKSDFLKMSWGKMGWAVFINLAARHEARFYDFRSERNDDKNCFYCKMRELFSLFIQKRMHIHKGKDKFPDLPRF